MPVNPPTGGWDALASGEAIAVTLPTTVEQHFWGRVRHAALWRGRISPTPRDDDVPRYGAYKGVSWWSRTIDIPALDQRPAGDAEHPRRACGPRCS
ncbi:hypothetical protein ACRAWD_15255 [Caulobacter segnis]